VGTVYEVVRLYTRYYAGESLLDALVCDPKRVGMTAPDVHLRWWT